MANPAVQLEADATKWLRGAKSIFLSVVDNYAFAQAIANDDYRDDYVTNDFFYYCVTKSTKSLIAIDILIQEELGEDAQILARSVYENYLAVSFLLANPDRLDDLVEKKIGVHTGYFKHPLNASGKKDRRRILDPRSGELVPFDVPIAEMLIKGRHSEDLEVHWPLYGFLSEHAHTHMVASGNYRAESQVRYSYSDPQQTLQASIWSTYVYLVLLGEIRYFEKLDQADLKRSTKIITSAIDILQRAFEVLKFEAPLDTLPAAMMRRLSKITEP